MQNVPTRPISKEIGMKNGELSDPEDELETRLQSEHNFRTTEHSLIGTQSWYDGEQ